MTYIQCSLFMRIIIFFQEYKSSESLQTSCDVNAVGAMDVSAKRSAAEFRANVIARSDDRATTEKSDNREKRRPRKAATE
jgi:hypothetical protein